MIKFKFVHFNLPEEYIDLEEYNDYREIDNPIGIDNLPHGEYMIRGDKKGQRKEYHHVNNKWFLINIVFKDNGNYTCDSTKYMLFPSLPEKQWIDIEKAGWKKLNKLWQRHLFAHRHWQDLRTISRDVKKCFLKIKME